MRMNLPLCNLKTCKFYSTGNCINEAKHDLCSYTELYLKSLPKPPRHSGVYFCPTCDQIIELEWKAFPYCASCGQALNWNAAEREEEILEWKS